MSIDLFDLDKMRDGADHPADLRAVLLHHDVAHPLETERAQRLALAAGAADRRAALGDLQARHQTVVPARARSMAAGATSSMGRPRRAAISSGRCRSRSAATVA